MNRHLLIGATANLLRGFRPVWDWADVEASPLQAPPVAALTTYPVEVEPRPLAEWSAPEVTLHGSPEDLITALFDYRVAPFAQDPGEFSLPAGTLFLGAGERDATLSSAGAHLGVDLRRGRLFLLVKMKRVVGAATHEVLASPRRGAFDRLRHLTASGRRAEVRLRPGRRDRERRDSDITGRQAEAYLEYFQQCGTHFVSTVEAGDALMQVFGYDRDRFESMAQGLRGWGGTGPIKGEQAINCRYYTSPEWTAEAGTIVSLSRDPALAATLEEGVWRDHRYAKTDSILAAWAPGADRAGLMARFMRIVPLGFELTPLNRFMEFFRAIAAQRVLKGCLIQRYSHGAKVPIRGADRTDNWDKAFPPRRLRTVANPAPTNLYHERINAATLANLSSEGDAIHLTGQILELEAGQRIELPHPRAVLTVRRVRCRGSSSAEAPVLVLNDLAFPEFNLTAAEMTGLLRVANRSGDRHRTILDGLVFKGGRNSLEVDDVRRVRLEDAEEALPGLAASLLSCERLVRLKDAVAEAIHHCRWLEELIPIEDDRLAEIRMCAGFLLNLASRLTGETISPPANQRATRRYVAAILALAERADDDFHRFETGRDGGVENAPSLDELVETMRAVRDEMAGKREGYWPSPAPRPGPRPTAPSDLAQTLFTELDLIREEALLLASRLDVQPTSARQRRATGEVPDDHGRMM